MFPLGPNENHSKPILSSNIDTNVVTTPGFISVLAASEKPKDILAGLPTLLYHSADLCAALKPVMSQDHCSVIHSSYLLLAPHHHP
jgi:hypothetical protein